MSLDAGDNCIWSFVKNFFNRFSFSAAIKQAYKIKNFKVQKLTGDISSRLKKTVAFFNNCKRSYIFGYYMYEFLRKFGQSWIVKIFWVWRWLVIAVCIHVLFSIQMPTVGSKDQKRCSEPGKHHSRDIPNDKYPIYYNIDLTLPINIPKNLSILKSDNI